MAKNQASIHQMNLSSKVINEASSTLDPAPKFQTDCIQFTFQIFHNIYFSAFYFNINNT